MYTQLQTVASFLFSLITFIHKDAKVHTENNLKQKFLGMLQTTAVSYEMECIGLEKIAPFCRQLQPSSVGVKVHPFLH